MPALVIDRLALIPIPRRNALASLEPAVIFLFALLDLGFPMRGEFKVFLVGPRHLGFAKLGLDPLVYGHDTKVIDCNTYGSSDSQRNGLVGCPCQCRAHGVPAPLVTRNVEAVPQTAAILV